MVSIEACFEPLPFAYHAIISIDTLALGILARRYSFWKGWFPKDTLEMPGITKGFERGLDLINQAIALGSDKSRYVYICFLSILISS